MQISTNSTSCTYGPAVFAGPAGAAPPSTHTPTHTPTQSSATSPWPELIDWNTCPPDGTEQSLRGALSCVAKAFQGDVYVGIGADGGEPEQYGSRDIDDHEQRAAVRSSVAEALHAKQTCLFAAASGQSSLVLQQLRKTAEATLALSFGGGHTSSSDTTEDEFIELGVVVCMHNAQHLQSKEAYATLMATTQRELRKWLLVWRRCRVGTQLGKWRTRWRFYQRRRGQLGLLVSGLILASMALPLPYWPQRPCVVEPAKKSFVSSPIDGRIRGATVRPGDVVTQGQVLAHLDAEQLVWQLSAAEAEYEGATKKRDTALATRAGGELRLAQLEQERIAVQIESLERQLERLELRSPSAGVVVQGDWFQSDGAAVARGEMLFEIAEMDRMRVEIHLSTDDLARLGVGDQATVRVDAAPGAKWSAELTRIDPRGKVIDSEVVFGATMDVDNDTNQLRPGMQGTSRISAGTQSLGWLLFHRPMMWAMKKLAW